MEVGEGGAEMDAGFAKQLFSQYRSIPQETHGEEGIRFTASLVSVSESEKLQNNSRKDFQAYRGV